VTCHTWSYGCRVIPARARPEAHPAYRGDVTLERLALSRSAVDRAAHRRADPELLGTALADPATRVLVLVGGATAVAPGDAEAPRLQLLSSLPPGVVADAPLLFFLGEHEGVSYVAAAWPGPSLAPGQSLELELPTALAGLELPDGVRWAGLRDVGSLLDDADAGVVTTGIALANWHATHPRCSRCGAGTDVTQAGWTRTCPQCRTEHFPRTDPAVIMTVTDADDRVLLGRQATWPERRFSTLAGFVEPGESLEAAVRREVLEEAGIVVGDVEYRGSQPWPFPASIMLGFRAHAETTELRPDGVELAEAHWWSREEFTADIASGALLVPPSVSIARRLIEDWYGGPLHRAGEAWR
jgi:NAD+ diphosphatase